MRLRSTVEIVDLELRVLVAYRAAGGVHGEVPPMRVFDELLDARLVLMAPSGDHEYVVADFGTFVLT